MAEESSQLLSAEALAEQFKQHISKEEYTEAWHVSEKRLAMLEETKGLFYPETLYALQDVCHAVRLSGSRGKAFDLYIKLKRRVLEAYWADHPIIIEALWGQSECLRVDGYEGEGLALLEKACSMLLEEESLSPDQSRAFALLQSAAGQYEDQGLYGTLCDWAMNFNVLPEEERFELQIRLARKASDGHDMEQAMERFNSAMSVIKSKPLKERRDDLREAKELVEKWPVIEAIELVNLMLLDYAEEYEGAREATVCLTELAEMYVRFDELQEAQRYFEKAVGIFNNLPAGEENSGSATSQTLGELAYAFGRIQESRALLREALQASLKESPESKATSDILHNLGTLLFADGEVNEAEAYLTHAVSMRKRHYGEDDLETALSLHAVGKLWQQLGRLAEARDAVGESLAIREGRLVDSDPRVEEARSLFAEIDNELSVQTQREERASGALQQPSGPGEPQEQPIPNNDEMVSVSRAEAPQEPVLEGVMVTPEGSPQAEGVPPQQDLSSPETRPETRVVEHPDVEFDSPVGFVQSKRKRKNTASQDDPLRRAILLVQRGEVDSAIEMLESLWVREQEQVNPDAGRRVLILENLADALEMVGKGKEAKDYRLAAQHMATVA